MISQTAEYALRAVVCLAEARGEPRTTRQLAELTRVPSGYLSKVLQALTRADIIRSQRGLGGGFALAGDASQLTAYDVIHAVDPIRRIRECPLGIESHRHQLCPLHQQLDDALASMEASFRRSTIADLVAQSDVRSTLCHDPSDSNQACQCRQRDNADPPATPLPKRETRSTPTDPPGDQNQ